MEPKKARLPIEGLRELTPSNHDWVLPDLAMRVRQFSSANAKDESPEVVTFRGTASVTGSRLEVVSGRPREICKGARAFAMLRLRSMSALRSSTPSTGEGDDDRGMEVQAPPERLAALRNWWDLLYFLMRQGDRFHYQLRFATKAGLGAPIDVHLVLGATGLDSQEASASLERLYSDLQGLLLVNAEGFELEPVTDQSILDETIGTTPTKDIVEIFQPERMDDEGQYGVSTFRLRPNGMGRIMDAMSVFPGALVYAVTFRPAKLTQREAAFLVSDMGHRGLLGPFDEPLRMEMRVHLASDRNIPADMIHRIGNQISGYPGRMYLAEVGPTDPEGLTRGGYEVHKPKTDSAFEEARRNLLNHEFLSWEPRHTLPGLERVRSLVDPIDLSTAARLPFPNLDGRKLTLSVLPTVPLDLPQTKGILLGEAKICGLRRSLYQSDLDASLHTYIVGKTGTGKTTLMANMILGRIREGHGVAVVDPHGDMANTILNGIGPEREKDVIILDPADTEWPVGLNLVEFDPKYPGQKTFLVNELFKVFEVLYNMNLVAGPMFEQYFRNGFLALMANPDNTPTIASLGRFLSDSTFRKETLSKGSNPIIRHFWKNEAEHVTGDAAMRNMVPYITSKLASFLANDYILPIIGQKKTTINFRQIMDERRILIVNLRKGTLGGLSVRLLGMVLVMRFLAAAMSRHDVPEENRHPFHLFVDEFQNLVGPSVGELLAEARKFGLRLTLANQYTSQIPDELREAVLGNVGTILSFSLGPRDAELVARSMGDPSLEFGLVAMDKYKALVRTAVNGEVCSPFVIQTPPPETTDNPKGVRRMLERTHRRYARPKNEVMAEIYKDFDL